MSNTPVAPESPTKPIRSQLESDIRAAKLIALVLTASSALTGVWLLLLASAVTVGTMQGIVLNLTDAAFIIPTLFFAGSLLFRSYFQMEHTELVAKRSYTSK